MRYLIAVIILVCAFSCKKALHTDGHVRTHDNPPALSKALSQKDYETARHLLLTDIGKYHEFMRTVRDISQSGNASRVMPLGVPDPNDNDSDVNDIAFSAGTAFSDIGTLSGQNGPIVEFKTNVALQCSFNKRGNFLLTEYLYGFGMTETGFIFDSMQYVNMNLAGPAIGEVTPASGFLEIYDEGWYFPPRIDTSVRAHAESTCNEKRTRVISTTGAVKFNPGFNAMGAQVGVEWSPGFIVQSIDYITGKYNVIADIVFYRAINDIWVPQPMYSFTIAAVNYGDQRN